ncbi:lipoprotein insertase outer membrane protein LolB [Gallaecimonas kandeliae]|uniref:lipoprotein insertase outer membrane protein LolB n=1 Tax=Gallaecimonas kandeliae TaxID=3029055 RepID=UPI00264850E4|nr:lipoprotein insertase outer membrane protein LolB [Gallaecimonas kandeliae]WKE64602.1 lipoprotein insertase outer membrane protein LolB [Gallaecimonas kandeliae]
MKKTLLLLLALVLLSACTSHPQGQWPAPNQPLDSYLVRGKVAVLGPDSRNSANLFWQQKAKHFKLQLTSFIGTSVLSMEGQPGKVSLTNDKGTFEDTDAQYLLYQLTGWQLPVADFPQWLKGQSGERGMVKERDELGRIRELSSEGWTVRYKSWTREGGRYLPELMDMTNGDIRIKLQINQWLPL